MLKNIFIKDLKKNTKVVIILYQVTKTWYEMMTTWRQGGLSWEQRHHQL